MRRRSFLANSRAHIDRDARNGCIARGVEPLGRFDAPDLRRRGVHHRNSCGLLHPRGYGVSRMCDCDRPLGENNGAMIVAQHL